MTTVAAAIKGGKICIGSDSLTLLGHQKETDPATASGEKVVAIGSSYIGIAGDAVWTDVLRHYFETKRGRLFSCLTIYETVLEMHNSLKDDYFLDPRKESADPVEPSEFSLLIVNEHGIFNVDWRRTVRQHRRFSAIGTGDEYALGAMQVLFDTLPTAAELVHKAVEVAAHFDARSAPPVALYTLELHG